MPELAQAGDHVPGVAAGVRVEPGGRLVQEQQFGVADQGQRQVQPAQLAPGQGPRPRPALAGQAHLLDSLRHVPRPGVEARVQGNDHLPHRQFGVDAARLQHDPDPLTETAPASAWVEPEHPHRAGRPLAVPLENLHRRGLASTIGPEQRVDLAAPDLKADAVHRTQPAVVLAQPLHHDGGRRGGLRTFHGADLQ